MKPAISLLTLAIITSQACATVPKVNGTISGIVRANQLQAQRNAAAAAARARANATGLPAYANGQVYNPKTPPAGR